MFEQVQSEVAAHLDPFVVLLGQDGADEADDRGPVGEDPHDVGASPYLDLPVKTLYKWRQEDVGPTSVRVGRHVRYVVSDVPDWLLHQRTSARAEAGERSWQVGDAPPSELSLVFHFFWNAAKFAWMAVLSLPIMLVRAIHYQGMMRSTVA